MGQPSHGDLVAGMCLSQGAPARRLCVAVYSGEPGRARKCLIPSLVGAFANGHRIALRTVEQTLRGSRNGG